MATRPPHIMTQNPVARPQVAPPAPVPSVPSQPTPVQQARPELNQFQPQEQPQAMSEQKTVESKSRPVKKHKAYNPKTPKTSKVVSIKGIPRPIVDEVCRRFAGVSIKDALICYLAVQTGVTDGLSDVQHELIASYDLTPAETMAKQLRILTEKLNKVQAGVNACEVAASYNVLDKLGMRSKVVRSTDAEFDLDEDYLYKVVETVEKLSASYAKRKAFSDGRPRRV